MSAKSLSMSPTAHKAKANSLGEFIKEVRQTRDWFQADLAKACGVDQSYISMVENGRWSKPPLDTVRKIYKNVLTNEEKAQLMLVLYSLMDEYVESP
jgi:transcriptional regulator with XRE-family HTH domain